MQVHDAFWSWKYHGAQRDDGGRIVNWDLCRFSNQCVILEIGNALLGLLSSRHGGEFCVEFNGFLLSIDGRYV